MTPLSRRRLLRASTFGTLAVALGACRPSASPAPSPVPTSLPPSQSASTPPATAAPSPSPQPSRPVEPTLAEKVAGLLVVGFRGTTLDAAPWLAEAIEGGGLGGVILFDRDQEAGGARNVTSPEQVAALVGDLRSAAGARPIIVAVDQEGGVVTRLSPAHGFPAVASQAAIGEGSLAQATAWARGLAGTLADVGIDLNLAPVVDLNVNPDNPAIGRLERSFSADPDVVVDLATIELEAHRAAGVRTALKHFPGIGSASANTDFGVADVTGTWSRTELEPFRRLVASGLTDMVMVGHVVNGRLDPGVPASLSSATVAGVLRGGLGWDGPVITDDLQAAAITETFGAADAILLALGAGVDLLLLANQQTYDEQVIDRVVDWVVEAVADGRLPEARIDEAWTRVRQLNGEVVDL